jgi:broad specificity polyphosphatase/5'/3'-nucleotidase SurE
VVEIVATMTDMFQEAVQRYTDTSWQIHRQSKKKSTTIPINTSPSKNDDETKIEIVKTNGVTPNGDVAKPSENDRPESRQVVQIETVEVTYEPVKSQVEVVLVREKYVSVTNNSLTTNMSQRVFF